MIERARGSLLAGARHAGLPRAGRPDHDGAESAAAADRDVEEYLHLDC